MIKIDKKRYNPMDFRIYYAHERPSGPLQSCIIIEWIDKDRSDTTISFDSEEERDNELKAWDEALLIVKDGKVVRGMPIDLPFLIDEGGMGGMGWPHGF